MISLHHDTVAILERAVRRPSRTPPLTIRAAAEALGLYPSTASDRAFSLFYATGQLTAALQQAKKSP